MLREFLKQSRVAILLFLTMAFITGLIYPGVTTLIAQAFFPFQANGSLLHQKEKLIGSQLIGQSFTSNGYFWGRPSATSNFPDDAANSAASNLGPSNPAFFKMVATRIQKLRAATDSAQPKANNIPADLVMTSGSGLDPDISPLAAYYQIPRIAKYRHLSEKSLHILVEKHIQSRSLGILGEPRVNVVMLNLDLDKQKSH